MKSYLIRSLAFIMLYNIANLVYHYFKSPMFVVSAIFLLGCIASLITTHKK